MTPTGWRASALGMSQRRRLTTCGAVGVVVSIVLAFIAPWQVAVLSGWDITALLVAGSVLSFVLVLDGTATRRAASREDLSTVSDDLVMLAASLVSLVGVVLTLIAANKQSGGLKAVMTTVAVLTVVFSWILVHTLFTLRYARLYYDAPEGGIDFNGDADGDQEAGGDGPDYRDFAYLAFTIGMTFQVSDTDISQRGIRRAVTRHALVGYVFGTVIVGVTINVVGGLIR